MTTYRNEDLIGGDTTRWLYDEPSGCMTNKLYADGKGPSYSYTPDGKLARRVWARGIATDYTYDNAGNLTRTEYNDTTPTITMSYDRVGNLTEATTAGVVTNLYAYNLVGNCTNEWQNDFNLTRYYDTLGRSTGYAINGERQTVLRYDAATGRLITMQTRQGRSGLPTASNGGEFTWTYLPGSDLKASLQYPNGLTASWTYDANNQFLQVRNATPTNVISQFDYTYDAAGRRTSITKTGSAFGDLSGSIDSYTYNARSELILARRTKNGQPIPGFSEDFDYDPIGNRRSSATYNEKGEAQTSTYEANNLNQYTSRTAPGYAAVRGEADPNAVVTVNENPTFRLGSYYFGSDLFDNSSSGGLATLETYATLSQTAANGDETDDLISSTTNQVYLAQSPETFAYDDDGNQTLITTKTGLWRVTYNGENRPVRWVRDSDNMTLVMAYDHKGRRRKKNTQRFFYNGYLQIADNAGNAYVWDPTEPVATHPLAWQRGNSAAYYTHDGNKNVSEVVAIDNDIAAHYEYAPFGALILSRGASAEVNPFRFSSEYAEDDTATVYYNYRHYEPAMGRWASRDMIQEYGGVLLYSCCQNNTVTTVDLLGLKESVKACSDSQDCKTNIQLLSDGLKLSKKRYDEFFNPQFIQEALEDLLLPPERQYKKGRTDLRGREAWDGHVTAFKDSIRHNSNCVKTVLKQLSKGKCDCCDPDQVLDMLVAVEAVLNIYNKNLPDLSTDWEKRRPPLMPPIPDVEYSVDWGGVGPIFYRVIGIASLGGAVVLTLIPFDGPFGEMSCGATATAAFARAAALAAPNVIRFNYICK